jgi:elongation factor G
VGKPHVAYREAITAAASDVHGKLIRQTGGRGAYGHVIIDVKPTPIERAEVGTFVFNNAVVGGEIPKEFIPKIRDGISDALKAGVVAGFPVLGVEVTLTGGSSHPVDSNEMAFKAAGSIAMQDALKQCQPQLLEPTMRVEVVCPEEYIGAVHGDIVSRRGQVNSIAPGEQGYQILVAEVPLSEMFGYSTDSRNKTQGRATYTMEFMHYIEVPEHVAKEISQRFGGTYYA